MGAAAAGAAAVAAGAAAAGAGVGAGDGAGAGAAEAAAGFAAAAGLGWMAVRKTLRNTTRGEGERSSQRGGANVNVDVSMVVDPRGCRILDTPLTHP